MDVMKIRLAKPGAPNECSAEAVLEMMEPLIEAFGVRGAVEEEVVKIWEEEMNHARAKTDEGV